MNQIEKSFLLECNEATKNCKNSEEEQNKINEILLKFSKDKDFKYYHGSNNKDIKILEPRCKNVRDKNEGKRVFTTNFKALASMFVLRLDDRLSLKFSYFQNPNKPFTPFTIIKNKEAIISNDMGGAIYECRPQDNDSFIDMSKGWKINECVSKNNVNIIKKEIINYGIEEMAKNGVDIFIAGDKLFNYISNLRKTNIDEYERVVISAVNGNIITVNEEPLKLEQVGQHSLKLLKKEIDKQRNNNIILDHCINNL